MAAQRPTFESTDLTHLSVEDYTVAEAEIASFDVAGSIELTGHFTGGQALDLRAGGRVWLITEKSLTEFANDIASGDREAFSEGYDLGLDEGQTKGKAAAIKALRNYIDKETDA